MATKNPVKKAKEKLKEATAGSGKRFGEEKPVQRNVRSTGPKPNRSPDESNANRWAADVKEDVVKSQKTDIDRLRKGIRGKSKEGLTPAQEAFGRKQTKAAAVRGALRTGSRLGYLGGAAGAGYLAGDTIKQLYDAAKEGRERRRLQEEYERELDKQSDIMDREDVIGLAKGGAVQAKMSKVMGEYKAGTLRSGGTGKAVKNPKQAIAIGLSEARRLKK
jgi:hypothetical protein